MISAKWWNDRHFIHHSKTNIIGKDDDIYLNEILIPGKIMPREVIFDASFNNRIILMKLLKFKKGEKKSGIVPYNYQHVWFFFTMPPLLYPIYFNLENFYHVIKSRNYKVLKKFLKLIMK